ncbi:putative ABC transporter substrate-binding protein YesO [Microbacterium hydrocarbonoxydans]|uniref:Putative ABC transporter substrate-binding protein YesO n=1 Tax=Microbacterium hydrocarbonoxydans TaxID=273678 RepID=A0A0M2HKQ8_9MICO|nr:sugar ABC transporter substrate-binding protein [Microbacterium hydrocarbonoxydans]KJL47271.1 putative ABC transporter substrate-binding protein YesO [Microbacterium hydrocarbonoxydans]
MKRTFLRAGVGIVAASLALGLAGCGLGTAGDGASTELSDEPVTIRMYWWGGDARHQRTQEVIDLFEKKHPNITVEAEFSDWNAYWEKLATSTAGKNSPDVIQMDQLYLASYADRGALADLRDLDISTKGMEESVLGMGESDGGLYAVPISTSAMATFVNTDLLDQIGVPLPDNTDSWTWDEYEAWAQSVTQAAPQGVYGGSLAQNEFMLQLFARQNGDELFADGDIAIDPETVEAFFQLALDSTKSGASAPASTWAETSGLALDQQPLSVGTVATTFATATQVSAYSQASGANLELVPIPTVKGGEKDADYFKAGMYWSVSSQSKHPAEAAALIDFFLNDPEAVKIIGTERGLPAISSTLDLIGDDLTPEESKAVAFSDSRLPFLGDAPAIVPNGASDVDAVIVRYMQDVLFERQTPADAAKGFIADITQSIASAG